MTKEEKQIVEKFRKDFADGTSDEEILKNARFIDDGKGLEVYKNVDEWRAAMKKRKEG